MFTVITTHKHYLYTLIAYSTIALQVQNNLETCEQMHSSVPALTSHSSTLYELFFKIYAATESQTQGFLKEKNKKLPQRPDTHLNNPRKHPSLTIRYKSRSHSLKSPIVKRTAARLVSSGISITHTNVK